MSTTEMLIGIDGGLIGSEHITAFDGTLGGEYPIEFCANTLNSYSLPSNRSFTVYLGSEMSSFVTRTHRSDCVSRFSTL